MVVRNGSGLLASNHIMSKRGLNRAVELATDVLDSPVVPSIPNKTRTEIYLHKRCVSSDTYRRSDSLVS